MNNGSQKKHILDVRTGPSTEHPLFETWRGMVRRCTDPKSDPNKIYYHRGIRVYPLWTERWERGSPEACRGMWSPGFRQFLNCVEDLCGERPDGYTLDRINPDGHYEPRSICWASPSTQQKNKRPFLQPNKNKSGYKWVLYRRGHCEGSFCIKGKRVWCGCGQDKVKVYEMVIAKRMKMGLPIPKG